MKTIIKCSILAVLLVSGSAAMATPRQLPFSYPYETLSQGELELELYGDVTPLRVAPADPTRGNLWEPAYTLQNEIEYGVTDRVELGFYQVFEANPAGAGDGGGNAMQFDGFKWRVRGRFAEAGEWPIDVGYYIELETMHDEVSLEEKVLLAKRAGPWHWMANLWVEQTERRPYDDALRSFHFVLNPTTGVEYQVTPAVHPGVEYWARGEIGTDDVNDKLHHFVGPTVHLNLGKLWWTFGVYANLNNMDKPQPGEIYGPVWARTVLGLNL
jgi:hypothetical protein